MNVYFFVPSYFFKCIFLDACCAYSGMELHNGVCIYFFSLKKCLMQRLSLFRALFFFVSFRILTHILVRVVRSYVHHVLVDLHKFVSC